MKKGQLAHINHNPDDHREENLAYLCLDHHDEYDSKNSQTKQLTRGELLHAKELLQKFVSLDGKHGQVDATITRDQDASPDVDDEDLLTQITNELRLQGEISLKKVDCDHIKLEVTVDADDLAKLMRADNRGDLKKHKVESVEPNIRVKEQEFRAPEDFVADVFTFAELIRLFRESEYFVDVNCGPTTVRFSSRRNPFDGNLATIMVVHIESGTICVNEPLIVRREDVTNWPIEHPRAFLTAFLDRHGIMFSGHGEPQTSLIVNRVIRVPHSMIERFGPLGAICRFFGLDPVASRPRTFCRTVPTGIELGMLYAIPQVVHVHQRKLASSVRWFT